MARKKMDISVDKKAKIQSLLTDLRGSYDAILALTIDPELTESDVAIMKECMEQMHSKAKKELRVIKTPTIGDFDFAAAFGEKS